MNYIKKKPYVLFLALIVILLGFGFYKGNEILDINIHDTYFVISWKHLMILISIIYGLLALTYFSILKLNFSLINWMTIFHVLISIIGLLAIFILPRLMRDDLPMDFSVVMENAKFNERIGYGIVVCIFALLGAQILFFINLICTLIKGRF
ncbi:MAG: hypothetical protein REI96_07415 [Flavobacterium nitrogenifigens]|uniref:Cytochrome C and Quinol oxidase polypeptide I n=1 Tax=Flavobacterium nitrogenifigens TaxID=1617283 RepID=A0A521EKV2_9FLAO|nr:hypothetical protein [Flavobacterium nitrogenifigens]KAF2326174.1 hypothetical protein DM397_23280 [Flavobacterium nitrogenifigens]MDQ8012257.1 hypothetical protein [Flavobacterium nitrogenifigens]SMO84544.1 hypothetical protein SAMN06265220_104399 [Flavobacterium nitrogenifigens]